MFVNRAFLLTVPSYRDDHLKGIRFLFLLFMFQLSSSDLIEAMPRLPSVCNAVLSNKPLLLCSLSLEVMTLNPVCENVETSEGVPLTVTGECCSKTTRVFLHLRLSRSSTSEHLL